MTNPADGVTVETPDGPIRHAAAASFHVDDIGCLHIVSAAARILATYAPGQWHKADPIVPAVLTEQATWAHGTFTREWHCEPPQPGIPFRVTDATWTLGHETQHVYKIELGQGREQR